MPPVPGSIISIPALYLRIFLPVLAVCFSFTVQSQLCNGSLGDPVVNITFGSVNNGNTSGFTSTNGYIYTPSSCPNDGYYTVTNSTSGCFGNSWHTVPGDHTGNGAFMLVNASFSPGDFFVTTVTNLCPNTTYEFAAWIMNVMNRSSIKPDITFSIETPGGIILQTFNTGDINVTSQPEWKQFGFFFTTPPDNAVIVLRMTNNAPGGIGNDIALDDITFRPCGPSITASIQGNSDKLDFCEGNTNSYTLNGVASSGYLSPVFQWQLSIDSGARWNDIPGANTGSYQRSPTGAGNYWYRLAVVEARAASLVACRIASNLVIINVHAKPFVDAGTDKFILTGGTSTLAGKVTGENPVYSWDPPDHLSDITVLTPTVSPVTDITYTLSAASEYGCSNNDRVQVKLVAGIYVPTAFTPNGDGKNETWKIPFLDPEWGSSVSVYNRYGQRVYYSAGSVVEWNGKFKGLPQPAGTYVYMVNFKTGYPDLKGTVTIIR